MSVSVIAKIEFSEWDCVDKLYSVLEYIDKATSKEKMIVIQIIIKKHY